MKAAFLSFFVLLPLCFLSERKQERHSYEDKRSILEEFLSLTEVKDVCVYQTINNQYGMIFYRSSYIPDTIKLSPYGTDSFVLAGATFPVLVYYDAQYFMVFDKLSIKETSAVLEAHTSSIRLDEKNAHFKYYQFKLKFKKRDSGWEVVRKKVSPAKCCKWVESTAH